MLVPVLMLLSLMLVLCLAQLMRQPYQYRSAQQSISSAQARALAQAGLADFRLKWIHDAHFPPEFPEGSTLFTYMEQMRHWQTGDLIGHYRVTVEAQWKWAPYRLYRVTSQGIVGPSDNPSGLFVIEAMLDIEPESRTGSGSNPNFGQWIEWRESGY